MDAAFAHTPHPAITQVARPADERRESVSHDVV